MPTFHAAKKSAGQPASKRKVTKSLKSEATAKLVNAYLDAAKSAGQTTSGRKAPAKKASKAAFAIVGLGSFDVAKPRGRGFAVGMPASTETKLSFDQLAAIAKAFQPA